MDTLNRLVISSGYKGSSKRLMPIDQFFTYSRQFGDIQCTFQF
ncbi:hypothetical protein EH2_01334 [Bacillus subtilis]|nr:hypothetical protein EH2_01334 [Bacillus subtilis]